MKDIVIIGAGGFGREVAWLVEEINKVTPRWNLLGFVDDNESLQGVKVNGYPILGDIEWLRRQEVNAVNSIGDPILRKKVIRRLTGSKINYPVLIHPGVIMSQQVAMGEGSIICAGTIMTVNIEIGRHVLVNLDCTIGHDVVLGDYTTILPSVNISGSVRTGECVSVGTGSAIIQGVTIGRNTIVGAGAVVLQDLPANCTAVGVPAKPIKYRK